MHNVGAFAYDRTLVLLSCVSWLRSQRSQRSQSIKAIKLDIAASHLLTAPTVVPEGGLDTDSVSNLADSSTVVASTQLTAPAQCARNFAVRGAR